MPKLGMEPIRREALLRATISEIGTSGSLNVTMAQIARRAGISSGLAHHYFGGKDDLFLAAMRFILREYGQASCQALRDGQTFERRLFNLLDINFVPEQFAQNTVFAWLNFYVQALNSNEAARLLRVYQTRLRSNLRHAFRPISDDPETAAATLAAMIDGLYLRSIITDDPVSSAQLLRQTATIFLGSEFKQ